MTGRATRSSAKPQVLALAAEGSESKICRTCSRRLYTTAFGAHTTYPDGRKTICMDCEYRKNTTGTPHELVQEGAPLKRAYYEQKIINGRPVTVRVIR